MDSQTIKRPKVRRENHLWILLIIAKQRAYPYYIIPTGTDKTNSECLLLFDVI